MNKLAAISAFLGNVKNRYIEYHPNNSIIDKIELASKIERMDGLELCYPADFTEIPVSELRKRMSDAGLGIAAVNIRTRRTGKWWRGSFSSAIAEERQELVDEFRKAMDMASEVGTQRVSTCPLNEGHDYVFEMDYFDAYKDSEEAFAKICEHNRQMQVCIEYKWNDPRQRCLLGGAAEVALFCQNVSADNLGATLDIGHSIQANERPAQAAALLHRANRLFYVHLNDNDRYWDWDMLPGSVNFWDTIEFLYYIKSCGYTDDWIAYDVMAKEVDFEKHFNLVTKLTRKLESLADKLDRDRVRQLLNKRNPNDSIEYLFDTLL
ncbi:MAG: sugar phosphate isomerase/epimerase [Opitutales bacterium]|nr:sugar phosphate isomerase/epimerase [Opitutales bacterium]